MKSEKKKPSFAPADKIASGICNAFKLKKHNLGGKVMQSGLSFAVSEWLKSPDLEAYSPALSEFSFTDPGVSFKKIWKVPLEIDDLYDGNKVIKYPVLNPVKTIFPPPGTFSTLCFGKLAVIDVSTGEAICISDFPNIFYNTNKDAKERIYRVNATGNRGNLTVVNMYLFFTHQEREGEKLTHIGESSGIVAAIYRK